jgi:hypothetical protein
MYLKYMTSHETSEDSNHLATVLLHVLYCEKESNLIELFDLWRVITHSCMLYQIYRWWWFQSYCSTGYVMQKYLRHPHLASFLSGNLSASEPIRLNATGCVEKWWCTVIYIHATFKILSRAVHTTFWSFCSPGSSIGYIQYLHVLV